MTHPLDNRIPPPVVMLATAAVMAGSASLFTPGSISPPLRYGGTGALLLLSGLFVAPAFVAFARAGTTINPVRIEQASALVTSGIYRVTRNPMYVGLTGLLVALTLGLARPWLLIGPLFFAAYITRFQIIPEERTMRAKFGDTYAAYCRRVRRWL